MVRIVLGVISGFFAWLLAWVGSEKILSAIWPEGFGAHQRAFEEALKMAVSSQRTRPCFSYILSSVQ
jgi:hypothetical protein